MKFHFLFFLFPCILLGQNNPPVGYLVKNIIVEEKDHVFFNFNTNTSTVKDQTSWDIALYNEVHEIGGMVNETKGVKVWRVYKDTSDFSNITLADTLNPVSNNSSTFYYGALDTMYTGSLSTSFNIGIGLFYQDNLVTVPTKMYIIKREDNVYGKFYLSYKSSGGRNFVIRYADINNANSATITVPKVVPLARHYRYIKLSDGTIQNDFEPAYNDWDVLFRKYSVGTTTYPIGVLTNNAHNLIRLSNVTGFPEEYLKEGVVKTEAYEAIGDPSTVVYDNSLNSNDPISRNHNQIGEKWFNTTTNQPVSGRSYFLKDRNNKLWHLVFTSYDAASKSVNIAYQQKGTVSSITPSFSISNNYLICQVGSNLRLVSSTPNLPTTIQISDLTGRILFEGKWNESIEIDMRSELNKILFIRLDNGFNSTRTKYSLH